MREVEIDAVSIDRLAPLLGPERAQAFADTAARAREALEGCIVWNVNATASGGGVAEMLTTLLAYSRGAGVDTRWLVLDGNPRFFRITKRIHNLVHGTPGDGGSLDRGERAEYEQVLEGNLRVMLAMVRPGDIVLLHDPQTAGLVPGLREAGARVVWRSHIGRDDANELTDQAWGFLRTYVEHADAVIFSRRAYVPEWVDDSKLWIIPPSLDPFSTKNLELDRHQVEAALRQTQLVTFPTDHGSLTFNRRNGSTGTVRAHHNLSVSDGPIPPDARVVMQVSRWDRLKDMTGVLTGFTDHLSRMPDDTHLALVGPDVMGVSDDPEGAEVLFECIDTWKGLPRAAQKRVHLISLPMDDVDENAHLVNALQRHATVVVQKSIVEGFGLTVTEPMWKSRAVVASAVGGIQDQIEDGENGLLLTDPTDLDAFAEALAKVLTDDELGHRLGVAAHERVRDRFLGDRHLTQYAELFATMLSS